MGRHVSVVMREDLFKKMEAERGRESKSSFMNHVLHTYFQWKKQGKSIIDNEDPETNGED